MKDHTQLQNNYINHRVKCNFITAWLKLAYVYSVTGNHSRKPVFAHVGFQCQKHAVHTVSVPRFSEARAACLILTEGIFASLCCLFKEEIYA